MTRSLGSLLNSLLTDSYKLTFLEKIYAPGNIEVADAILELHPNNRTVIKREIAHAGKNALEERFKVMARKYIDNLITAKVIRSPENTYAWDMSDTKEVVSWENEEMTDYALSQIRKLNDKSSLINGANLAEASGKTDKRKSILERLFQVQMRTERKEYPSAPAETAEKLGRYEEAINLYLEGNRSDKYKALILAQKHSSAERVKKIARIGFNEFNIDRPQQNPEFYLHSASILGKLKEAKETLKISSQETIVDTNPHAYRNLVKALRNMGALSEARAFANRIEEYEFEEMKNLKHYRAENQRSLADIFLYLKDESKAVQAYTRKIEFQSSKGHHLSNYTDDIEIVYKMTGDKSIFKTKFLAFEKEGQYRDAANLARRIGETELVNIYRTMERRVAAVEDKN